VKPAKRTLLAALTATLLSAALLARLLAAPPAWWSDSTTRVLVPTGSGPIADNYAVANLGQLKHVATMAKKHLDQHLATWGGAGPGVNAVVAGFAVGTPDNYAPANLGQLKAVAKPFYDRLREVGMNTNASLRANGYPGTWTHDYPWNPTVPLNQPTPPGQTVDKSTNFAPINLGQLKLCFSFDLAKDTDGDLMPDWWENAHGLSATDDADAAADADGDGWTNSQEYHNGGNPQDSNSGAAFPIAKVIGNGAQGIKKTKTATATLPAGNIAYIVVVGVQTDEYPQYTAPPGSAFDDVVDWKITPAGGVALTGSVHVNDLDQELAASEVLSSDFLGLSPYAIRTSGIVRADPSGPKEVIIEVSATNVRDGIFPTTAVAALLPFEVSSDLDNNGKIDGTDSSLKTASLKSGATDEAKEKGTEYLFVDDKFSNGLWDKDDPLAPNGPFDQIDDDDTQELKTICVATMGAVWFEYEGGDISKLAFYRTKECKQTTGANGDKMTFPFALSTEPGGKLPEKLYVRAEGNWTAQVEGKLVMKFGKVDKSETWADDKLLFTIVKELGDKKFFHAARDYIMENNTRFFVHEKKYGSGTTDPSFRIVCMREEGSVMYPIDAAQRPGGGVLNGIDAVTGAFPGIDVAINGNMCFFSVDYYNSTAGKAEAVLRGLITDKCHGRIVRSKIWDQLVSSDNDDVTTSPKGSLLAGETYGRYIAQYDEQKRFVLAAGRVPVATAPDQVLGNPGGAMGGLSTNYDGADRIDREYQAVGYAPVSEAGKGIVFTATQYFGTGKGPDLAADAKKSGVQALPGGNGTSDIQLLLLDGGTSTALAYTNPDGEIGTHVKNFKHRNGYFINTYLLFRCAPPRSTAP